MSSVRINKTSCVVTYLILISFCIYALNKLLDRMTCNFTWMLMTDVPTQEKNILPILLPFIVEAENFSDHPSTQRAGRPYLSSQQHHPWFQPPSVACIPQIALISPELERHMCKEFWLRVPLTVSYNLLFSGALRRHS